MPHIKDYEDMNNEELEWSDYGRDEPTYPEMIAGCLFIVLIAYVIFRLFVWIIGFFI